MIQASASRVTLTPVMMKRNTPPKRRASRFLALNSSNENSLPGESLMDNRTARRFLLLAVFVFILISSQPLYGQPAPAALRHAVPESQQATKDAVTAGSSQVAADEVMTR